jgi:phosphoribosylaminoimidazolecarboxamide formyltransferase/IMP cyclohydrolase
VTLRVVLSVSDKTGIEEFGKALHQAGAELVSTGGTFSALNAANVPVRQVSDVTGFPEVLDGRVKTLHPVIHAGLLARRDVPAHLDSLKEHGIEPIDLVCVNLYPFVQTISKAGVTLGEALENIDIGGPTLLRAAAKNFPSVIVVVDPSDYGWVAERLQAKKPVELAERQELARKAFAHVSTYDSAIARYLTAGDATSFPAELPVGFRKLMDLRYGENPHQQAAFYAPVLGASSVGAAKQLHGKELSYNNILDADAAWQSAVSFDEQAVAVVKHTNTCGLAVHEDQVEAYKRALAGDPVSAFGGIVACNRPVTAAMAEAMKDVFYEIVMAPGYEPAALETLQKKKNLRILEMPDTDRADGSGLELRQVRGGMLVQTEDFTDDISAGIETVGKRGPTEAELRDLAFAWRAVRHIKSNAIVFVKDRAIVGMGAGQPNRVISVRLAAAAAGDKAKGAVMASDAFFPFPDGVEAAGAAGITAVVQPGGSIRDQEVIDAADAADMAMVVTGTRHFKH